VPNYPYVSAKIAYSNVNNTVELDLFMILFCFSINAEISCNEGKCVQLEMDNQTRLTSLSID
jgi:hypothetical protein